MCFYSSKSRRSIDMLRSVHDTLKITKTNAAAVNHQDDYERYRSLLREAAAAHDLANNLQALQLSANCERPATGITMQLLHFVAWRDWGVIRTNPVLENTFVLFFVCLAQQLAFSDIALDLALFAR